MGWIPSKGVASSSWNLVRCSQSGRILRYAAALAPAVSWERAHPLFSAHHHHEVCEGCMASIGGCQLVGGRHACVARFCSCFGTLSEVTASLHQQFQQQSLWTPDTGPLPYLAVGSLVAGSLHGCSVTDCCSASFWYLFPLMHLNVLPCALGQGSVSL